MENFGINSLHFYSENDMNESYNFLFFLFFDFIFISLFSVCGNGNQMTLNCQQKKVFDDINSIIVRF